MTSQLNIKKSMQTQLHWAEYGAELLGTAFLVFVYQRRDRFITSDYLGYPERSDGMNLSLQYCRFCLREFIIAAYHFTSHVVDVPLSRFGGW